MAIKQTTARIYRKDLKRIRDRFQDFDFEATAQLFQKAMNHIDLLDEFLSENSQLRDKFYKFRGRKLEERFKKVS